MAIDRTPVLKRCRSLGLSPAFLGISKESNRQVRRQNRKKSEYGIQLTEKQKAKFIYGVLEKQFRGYYDKAKKMEGIAGENLLILLERRITVMENSRGKEYFKGMEETLATKAVPAWLIQDAQNLGGKVDRFPTREEIDVPIEEHLIVELYSK